MKNWYQLTESETLDNLGVTSEGLSSQQADSLLEKHGKNVLEESKKKSVFQVFLSQFADLMVIILIIAAIVSMFSGSVESTIVIFAVITLNAILGSFQLVKADNPIVRVLLEHMENEVAANKTRAASNNNRHCASPLSTNVPDISHP